MATDRAAAVVARLREQYADGFDPAAFTLFPDTEATGPVDPSGAYGDQPAFECLVRTILSQNTTDSASLPAHRSLLEQYDDGTLAPALAAADHDELAETIQSAGLYNQKAGRIIDAAAWILEEFGSAEAFDEFVTEADPETVRETLLSVGGVGPKTADCVLLFAGGRKGVFPVDTHIHRVARRLGIAPADADHEAARAALESTVPPADCGFGHTAMLQFGRDYCSARQPVCLDGPDACPLADLCDRVGVDIDAGTVVDPADTT